MASQTANRGALQPTRKAKHNLSDVLIRKGFVYSWTKNTDGKAIINSILPAERSHEVTAAFKKHLERSIEEHKTNDASAATSTGESNSPKAKFDEFVAELIKKGTRFLKLQLDRSTAPDVPEWADFWIELKRDTMFESVCEDTVYLFVLKLMQGRQAWAETTRDADLEELEQLKQHLSANNLPYTSAILAGLEDNQVQKQTAFHGQTAVAIDAFLSVVRAIKTVNPGTGEDLASQYLDETVADDVEKLALDQYSGAAQDDEDDEDDDSDNYELEDELESLHLLEGIRQCEVDRIGTIEQEDAWRAWRMETWPQLHDQRFDKTVWFGLQVCKDVIAQRAPLLAALLDGSKLPAVGTYEADLEKRLAAHYPVDWELRAANYEKAREELDREEEMELAAIRAEVEKDDRERELLAPTQGLSIDDSADADGDLAMN